MAAIFGFIVLVAVVVMMVSMTLRLVTHGAQAQP